MASAAGKTIPENTGRTQWRAQRRYPAKHDDPTALGFYTSLVLQGAEESLAKGTQIADGVTRGIAVDLKAMLTRELGQEALAEYGY